jgi:hypothetical protein
MKTISNTIFGGFCEKGAVAAVGHVFDAESLKNVSLAAEALAV